MSRSKTSNSQASAGKGCLVILSAPSGCGKTTIADRLLKRHPEWIRSISVTTRPPREGEKNGADYFFVSREDFQRMESKGELLESAKVFGQHYGTPKQFILDHLKQGQRILLTIDVQGTAKLKQSLAKDVKLLTIFILPPSVKALRERLENRQTESLKEVEARIEIAQEEIKEAGGYDVTVVNRNLEQTISEIENYIERCEKGAKAPSR